ncbi:MAG TPA: aspartate carbamoyltransferase catalytic subunit [Alphaproteobacteria bacterium]|nr:aspartate carbamoyltransferase catalytic subunit [Alphaproteobacteria bacterium]
MARAFSHRHLLDIERLSQADIEAILKKAESYDGKGKGRAAGKTLAGKTIVNLFFEPSTRTRTSFEIAAKRLGAGVVNIPVEHSSTKKGETLLDTVLNLDAMKIDALVIRHSEDGVPQFIAPHMKASVINAGDGKHEHPTQALVDAFVMRRHKKKLKGLVVAYIGDIQHSRVARSNIHLLNKFGAKVRIIAPSYFMPQDLKKLGVEAFDNMKDGLKDVDVITMLRIQHERLGDGEFAVSLKDYRHRYGLDHDKLKVAKKDVIIMHPGPVNRDVEITSELADDPKYSLIREQVACGVAVKMAVLELLLGTHK